MRLSSSRRAARSAYQFDVLESRLLLAATKVVFGNGPVTLAAGAAAAAMTVQLQDAGGAAATGGAGGPVITLSTSSSGGTFVDGTDQPITNVTVAAGSSSASFGYKDSVAALPTLVVSGSTLASALQQETITATAPTQLAFTSPPAGALASTASTSITVTLRDALGNVAPAPAGGTVLNLSSTSAGGTFSSGAAVTISAGASAATFTYRDTLAGTPTLTASSSGLTSATQQQTI